MVAPVVPLPWHFPTGPPLAPDVYGYDFSVAILPFLSDLTKSNAQDSIPLEHPMHGNVSSHASNSSSLSETSVFPAICHCPSMLPVVLKDQQPPQSPWSLTSVTAPFARQSTELAVALTSAALN